MGRRHGGGERGVGDRRKPEKSAAARGPTGRARKGRDA